jgi:hypothetical protein
MPMGFETKKDCADEDQQQFTGIDWSVVRWETVAGK